MAVGIVGKIRTGAASSAGAPKKPSIPAAKSVKAAGSRKGGMAGVKG